MKAMIAAAILLLCSQVLASSFDDFANTHTGVTSVNKIIVKLKGSENIRSLDFGRSVMNRSNIIQDMNLHLLQINPMMNIESVLAEVRNHPAVAYAQLDHKITLREGMEEELIPRNLSPQEIAAGPDDTDFAKQWSMGLSHNNFGIDAISAWTQFGTGGKDAKNNDLVVAVIDGGVETRHKDLVDNIWVNAGEIPGNGIDDDNNGYVDDIHGWNAYSDSGNLISSGHGTHVSGIVGAKGNNQQGVAGVNWDVKIMNIPGSTGNTSVALRAYNYVLNQKKLWLATNGQQGANIVATNSSFGIDYRSCTVQDFPAWNDIYTEMGKVGILSAAATINSHQNIDKVGDVPTSCDSDYLVSVTNTRSNGKKASAGYGKVGIDLAAPGTQILSTYNNDSTRRLSGTSMATPHVAGAIAYLHSIASKPLVELYDRDPAAAALEIKRILMDTVTPTIELESQTVAGGILNLNAAAEAVTTFGMGN